MILGSLLLFDSPNPMMRVSLSVILPFTLTTAGITFFLTSLVIKSHKRKAMVGVAGMIGKEGEAKSHFPVGKEGKIFVHGEIWNATCAEGIKKGDKIKVLEVKGMTLRIKKI